MSKSLSGVKIFGWRQSLIGDSITALPLLTWAEKKWPGSFKYWQIARKCSQAAPLYYNHPLINELAISDCDEGMGARDIAIAQSCHVRVNTMPSHPHGDLEWANRHDIYHETALMAGLDSEEYNSLEPHEKIPKLWKWFDTDRQKSCVAIWPCAGYGAVQKHKSRYPSFLWSSNLSLRLSQEGYKVYQFGHPNDYALEGSILPTAIDLRHLSFFEQIKMTLGCDVMIGTDSGSSLVIGAYGLVPQVSLLTNHIPGHVKNFHAMATNSPLNTSLFSENIDDIDVERVIYFVKNI